MSNFFWCKNFPNLWRRFETGPMWHEFFHMYEAGCDCPLQWHTVAEKKAYRVASVWKRPKIQCCVKRLLYTEPFFCFLFTCYTAVLLVCAYWTFPRLGPIFYRCSWWNIIGFLQGWLASLQVHYTAENFWLHHVTEGVQCHWGKVRWENIDTLWSVMRGPLKAWGLWRPPKSPSGQTATTWFGPLYCD